MGELAAEETQGEELLQGGNTSVVVRVGDTVRRHTGHWTPAVQALLEHLTSVGFVDAPTVLGIDDRGREVLTYVRGEVGLLDPGGPVPPWFRTVEGCMAIGDWLRRFHDAQRGFIPDPALPWRLHAGRDLLDGEVVVHNDAAPYNTIRRPDGGLSVIDWDFCAPGDPIEDLAYSAWRWAPLWADNPAVASQDGQASTAREAATNLAGLADGYGATAGQRSKLLDACVARMNNHADGVEAMAVTDPTFARLVDLGVPRDARRDAEWVSDNRVVLSAAIQRRSPT